MTHPEFVDRGRLQRWANDRRAQSEFPRLIRRLILETTPDLVDLGMPAGNGVSAAGWDGSVSNRRATPWVPKGLSVWELSVNSSPGKKADSDYAKRTGTPDGSPTEECTYVEAILRPWTAREKWATRKREERIWRDVKALGLDEIEMWLESAPITRAWLSEELGLSPYGLHTGLTWWNNWAAQTKPRLTPEALLAGRNEVAMSIEDLLSKQGVTVTISGPSTEEICAFIAALALKNDREGKRELLARLVFVSDLLTWRRLLASPQSKVLVPLNSELWEEIPEFTTHTLCVPVRTDQAAKLVLPPLDAEELANELNRAGLPEEFKHHELGSLGRRSLTALRRKIATNPDLHTPRWATQPLSRKLRAILCAGSWQDGCDGDREIIEMLAGTEYEEFRDEIAGIADDSSDPMVMRTGVTWHLVSPLDAWMLVARYLTNEDLRRLRQVVESILTERDPAFDLPSEQRWMAAVKGKRRHYSPDLRRGITQTLALLSAHGKCVALPGGATGGELADDAVRIVLEWASMDLSGEAWQSLADILPFLAEAAPDRFLSAVEAGSAGENPLLAKLFQDGVPGFDAMFESSPHVSLLRALECVSWSPDYFGRVVRILARLDEIDPGGRMASRPEVSLAAIFRTWYRSTSVEYHRRLAVLDALRHSHQDTAWKVEVSMLPLRNGIHHYIEEPRYRSWLPDSREVTIREYREVTTEAIQRCIQDAKTSAVRWVQILKRLREMDGGDRDLVISALDARIGGSDAPIDSPEFISRVLLDIISQLRNMNGVEREDLEQELSVLESLAKRCEPKSAYRRSIGLFEPHIVNKDFRGKMSPERVEAIREIAVEGGFEAVARLAQDSTDCRAVGRALAETGLPYEERLLGWLVAEKSDLVDTAISYFSRIYGREGFERINDLLKRKDLSVEQRASLLLVARDSLSAAWTLAAEDPDLEAMYWERFDTSNLMVSGDQFETGMEQLIRFNRHFDFLHVCMWSGILEDEVPNLVLIRLITRALEEILDPQYTPTASMSFDSAGFQRLFDYLESKREYVGQAYLVSLEWKYLPILGPFARVPTLSETFGMRADAFVYVVCKAFGAEPGVEDSAGDDSNSRRGDEMTAELAYRALQAWNHPPGLVDGLMDGDSLRKWFSAARKLLEQNGRSYVGLHQFGQVLGYTPPDSDGTWPGVVVRGFLEEVQSAAIETGLYMQIVNSRGITSRKLGEGGGQERQIADEYRVKAEEFADSSPRTAAVFRQLVLYYEREGRNQDAKAERFRRGLA